MRGAPGIYQVRSTGKELACGVYLVADPESQIEIEFLDFKVDCKNDGIVGVCKTITVKQLIKRTKPLHGWV